MCVFLSVLVALVNFFVRGLSLFLLLRGVALLTQCDWRIARGNDFERYSEERDLAMCNAIDCRKTEREDR